MDYIAIYQLFDKCILLMLADLRRNNYITGFSMDGHLNYTYYYQNELHNKFSNRLPNINITDTTIEFSVFPYHKYIYNLEDIKTEENMKIITDILKESIFNGIRSHNIMHIGIMLTSLSDSLLKTINESNETKQSYKNGLYTQSERLVDILNKTILSDNYFFKAKSNDSTSTSKKKLSLNLNSQILDNITLNKTTKKAITNKRIGQHIFRKKLLALYDKCALCGFDLTEILKSSHIKPWKDCNDSERLDPANGLLLCPSHDAIFDKGYISFYDDGKIMISDLLNDSSCNLLNINHDSTVNLDMVDKYYLKCHRDNIFKK